MTVPDSRAPEGGSASPLMQQTGASPGWLTVAHAVRRVPFSRTRVWQALAILEPYCAVCDVSYVVVGASMKRGTDFVCVPGRLGGRRPPAGAPRGRVVEWEPEHRVATRLELTSEVWVMTIDLADAPDGSTDVGITLTHEPLKGGLLQRRRQRKVVRKVARDTVESELGKVADHIRQAERASDGPEDPPA